MVYNITNICYICVYMVYVYIPRYTYGIHKYMHTYIPGISNIYMVYVNFIPQALLQVHNSFKK